MAASNVLLVDLQSRLRQHGLSATDLERPPERFPAAPTGLSELDAMLGGGLPRGEISECVGGVSSGCTAVALSALAHATVQGELVAYVDASDSLDPHSAERAGISLEHFLWVRCGQPQLRLGRRSRRESRSAQAWKATQFVAAAGGFGLIVMDLIGLPLTQLRGFQSSPWFGLRQTIANSQTAVLALSAEHVTGSVAAQTLSFKRERAGWRGSSGAALRLTGVLAQASIRHQRRSVRGQAKVCRFEPRR